MLIAMHANYPAPSPANLLVI